ncbi:MAG: hypothetical protein WAU96_13825 [Anaerolineae bacterium]
MRQDLPIVTFKDRGALHQWLIDNHAISPGVMVRVFKKHSHIVSVSFEDLLEEGLCFGWSESKRLSGNADYYLQQFTPRKTRGTASARNMRIAAKLIKEGRMNQVGLIALNISHLDSQ